MYRKLKIPDKESESTNLDRRGFLTRFGVAVAAAPVLIGLSGSAFAKVPDGGHDGDDGGHGTMGAVGSNDGDSVGQKDRIDDVLGYKDGHKDAYRETYARNYHDKDDTIGMDAVD